MISSISHCANKHLICKLEVYSIILFAVALYVLKVYYIVIWLAAASYFESQNTLICKLKVYNIMFGWQRSLIYASSLAKHIYIEI